MSKRESELLFRAIRRYLFHSSYRSGNETINQIYAMMADMDLDELWMITQRRGGRI